MEFKLSKRARNFSFALIIIGAILTIYGVVTDHSAHHQQSWVNLFVNGFFFFGIALGALFFYALQYATEAAYTVLVKRIYEAVYSYLPIGALVLIICFAAGSGHMHHIWHWMDSSLMHEYVIESTIESDHPEYVDELVEGAVSNVKYDYLIAGKKAYLNNAFWWIRNLIYLGTFLFAARWFRKESLAMDSITGESLVKRHLKNYRRGALFLVFFAVFSSMMAWDWLMSIDAHWFSTLYGWYVFSGMWVTAMIVSVIVVLYLKSRGYMPQVNNSHIHDMGKWVFAISFLWSYLWFSQFMLIWYSDIPEEVAYFQTRIEEFTWPFWIMFFINFILPMVLLMSRDAKRNPRFLITIGTIIFIGHWVDVYLLVAPGTLGHWHPGPLEVGMFALFLGVFIYRVLGTLGKSPLTPVNHPYLDESIHHQI